MEQRADQRRQRTISLRWPERRTGFDRREDVTVEVLRDNPTVLLFALTILNLLSILDWRLTVLELSMGATEANPIMAAFFAFDPTTAGLFKVALMLTVSLIIWRGRRYRRVLEMAVLAMMVYTALIVYHIAGLAIVVSGS